jgi:lipopolysaccharide export system protein LptC
VDDRGEEATCSGHQESGNPENVDLVGGVRLETSVLRWQSAEKRLWTDAPVRISRGGTVADGSALEVRMAEEYTTLAGRVHAVFTGGQP